LWWRCFINFVIHGIDGNLSTEFSPDKDGYVDIDIYSYDLSTSVSTKVYLTELEDVVKYLKMEVNDENKNNTD